MGGGEDPPQPYSDPAATAAGQAQWNKEAAAEGQAASNVNQITPYGSLNYAQTGTGPGGIPLWTATQTLSPQMQAIVNSLQGGITNQLGTSSYGTANASDVIGNATEGNVKNMLDKETSYLQPFFTQQQEQLDAQLRNQGISPDQPAYTRAMNNLAQSQNQSVTGFLATAAPQAQQMAMTNYLAPLGISKDMMALLNPNFLSSSLVNPPQASVQPPNYQGAVSDYNTQLMNSWKQQQENNNAMMGNLFRIPTSILGGWAGSPAGGAALTAGMAMI